MLGKPNLTFLIEAEARPRPGDPVYRERILRKLINSIFFLALAGGAGVGVWMAAQTGGMGFALAGIAALMWLVLVIMFLLAYAGFRASQRPSNWVLRATVEGLFIHYRSYLNSEPLAGNPTVVFVPHREIDWIRGGRQTQSRSLPDDTVTEKRHYLEIGLRRDDLSALQEKLSEDRALVSARKSRFNHFPAEIADGAIRIEWRSPRTAIVPGLHKALENLGQNYPIIPAHAEILDDDRVIDPAEQEELIRGYLARGQTMTAIKLAREYFGYDLLEARKYVDDLKKKL